MKAFPLYPGTGQQRMPSGKRGPRYVFITSERTTSLRLHRYGIGTPAEFTWSGGRCGPDPAGDMGASVPGFLPNLTSSFEHLTEHDDIGTQEFVDACESVFPIFNALGEAWGFLLAPRPPRPCRGVIYEPPMYFF